MRETLHEFVMRPPPLHIPASSCRCPSIVYRCGNLCMYNIVNDCLAIVSLSLSRCQCLPDARSCGWMCLGVSLPLPHHSPSFCTGTHTHKLTQTTLGRRDTKKHSNPFPVQPLQEIPRSHNWPRKDARSRGRIDTGAGGWEVAFTPGTVGSVEERRNPWRACQPMLPCTAAPEAD